MASCELFAKVILNFLDNISVVTDVGRRDYEWRLSESCSELCMRIYNYHLLSGFGAPFSQREPVTCIQFLLERIE